VRISLACWDYDRTRGLREGRIRPDGVELEYLSLPPEETFFRMVRHREFDAAELSLSSYVISLRQAEPPFVAVPVFPSRAFRHSAIYVARDRGISSPADLRGRRVGVAEYQLTANVWVRGILAEHHGLPVDSVTYVTGGLEDPARIEKLAVSPPGVRIERAPAGATLSELLAAGEIDALYSPRAPSTLGRGGVARLFEDYERVEREYFAATRIFPIMHVVAIRRDVYEGNRWIAQSLAKAFAAAKAEAQAELAEVAALKVMLPWVGAHLRDTAALMGEDYWAYGVEPNRHVLERFLAYSASQGLADPAQDVDSLFAPETLESFAI
jgi:4,5-dihydroxyphthalate decarboxylase